MKILATVFATAFALAAQASDLEYVNHSTGYVPGTGQIEVSSMTGGRIQVIFDQNACETTPGGRPTTCGQAPALLWRVTPKRLEGYTYELTYNLRLDVRYTHDGPKYEIGLAVFEDREYGPTITGWRWIPLKEGWELP